MRFKHNILFSEEAKEEIKESYTWYEDKLPDLGERFLSDINHCLARIDQNPEMYRIVYRNHRQGQLSVFPFVIIYEIQSQNIIVLSVFHTSRNPEQRFGA